MFTCITITLFTFIDIVKYRKYIYIYLTWHKCSTIERKINSFSFYSLFYYYCSCRFFPMSNGLIYTLLFGLDYVFLANLIGDKLRSRASENNVFLLISVIPKFSTRSISTWVFLSIYVDVIKIFTFKWTHFYLTLNSTYTYLL